MIDLRAFRKACWDAAQSTGGEVAEFRISDGVTPNFHQALVRYVVDHSDETVAIVCRREEPILAVAEPRQVEVAGGSWGPLTFADHPGLAGALAESPGFQLVTTAELNGPFDPAQWPQVTAYDIRMWKPGTLGEALFNFWD